MLPWLARAAVPRARRADNRAMTTTKTLNIGVIGFGGRGWLSRFAHDPANGVRIVAGADVSEKPVERFRAAYEGVMVTRDYRELLRRDDIDAVFVTSPDFCHEEHALAALEAGKAVYLEKPMAITIAGCDRILRAAMRKKARLFLGHNMRHTWFVRKMKELIDSGAIGEVKTAWCRHFIAYGGDAYFKDWHAERSKATSLLLQKAAHDIDVLHWLCGGFGTRVNAMGSLMVYDRITDRHAPDDRGNASWEVTNWPPLSQKGLNPIIDVEDVSMLHMRLDNGVLAAYQQCHFTPDSCRNYTIIGTAGRIENVGDVPGDCVIKLWNQRKGYADSKPDQEFPWAKSPTGGADHGGSDQDIVREFVRFAREGGATTTSPVAARHSVAVGCRAAESLRADGAPFDIPPLEPELVRYFERQP